MEEDELKRPKQTPVTLLKHIPGTLPLHFHDTQVPLFCHPLIALPGVGDENIFESLGYRHRHVYSLYISETG